MATTNSSEPVKANPVDAKVMHPLERLRAKIRRYVLLEGIASVALFLVLWFWLGLIFDYGVFKLFLFDWVQEAPRQFRGGILIVIVLGIVALFLTRVLIRFLKEFSAPALALILERQFPALLGDRLITAVELADVEKQKSYGYSEEMIRRTIEEAKERVDQIPVSQVLNWRRLRLQGLLFLGLSCGLLLIVGIAICAIFRLQPKQFAWGFSDVATIWTERNVLLENVAWPRRAYLEIQDFPGTEMRIGRDAAAPKLRVQAYKWVWADKNAPEGLRPLTWADLPSALPGETFPDLPVEDLRRIAVQAQIGGLVLSTLSSYDVVTLPGELKNVPQDLNQWRIDRIEELLSEGSDFRAYISLEKYSGLLEAIQEVLTKLDAKAADPAMSRTLRKLTIPDEVKLTYRGLKTSVEMNLQPEPGYEFTGALTDLKESVDLRVQGEDYITANKRITIVPAPALIDLKRTEYRPAYLYHRPVLDSDKALFSDPLKLKGLKQEMKDLGISLTGERSRFDIPLGTELTLYGSVDKDLKEAFLIAKPGRFPGLAPEADLKRIPLTISEDQRTVEFTFSVEKGTYINRPVEFDLEFRDTDNVASRRTMQIQPFDDKNPEVDVVVETIRKVGNVYLCTPKAIIPFAKESKIRDENGINKIEYVYTYTQLESATDLNVKASVIGLFLHNSPQLPSFSQGFYRAGMIYEFSRGLRSESKTSQEVAVLLDSFKEDYLSNSKGGFQTIDKLQGLLKQPVDPQQDLFIKYFDFKNELGFDIAKVLPGLAVKDPENTPQPHYQLTLNVVATDSNVETGPKLGVSKEPMVFRIVGEAELIAEISREEADLAMKLDEVIRRVEDNQRKYQGMADRIPSISSKDEFVPEQTLSNTILEGLGKAKDLTQEIYTDYSRILKEYETNRFNPQQISRLQNLIVRPLEDVLRGEFVRTEESHNAIHTKLNQTVLPAPAEVALNRQRFNELVSKLRGIRLQIGEVLSFGKLIADAQKIIKEQTGIIGPGLNRLIGDAEDRFAPPVIKPIAPITIAVGGRTTVTVELEWALPLRNPYFLRPIVPADSAITASPRIDVRGEPEKVSFELKAGDRKGEFTVRLVPYVGDAVEFKVFVK